MAAWPVSIRAHTLSMSYHRGEVMIRYNTIRRQYCAALTVVRRRYRCFDKEETPKMDLSKTGVTENSEDASSDSEVAQFYRPGLCHYVV